MLSVQTFIMGFLNNVEISSPVKVFVIHLEVLASLTDAVCFVMISCIKAHVSEINFGISFRYPGMV